VVKPFVAIKDLGLELVVVVGVALIFTVSASVFEQFHQVAAEDLNIHEVPAATTQAGSQQVINLQSWGVELTLPLGHGLPLMSYAVQGPDSVGLSSADVEKYGPDCAAGRNAVGALLRVQPDGVGRYLTASQRGMVMGQVGGYDYVYQLPSNSCMNLPPAANLAAQESLLIEGVGTLGPMSK
jgi:hypothetical protein